MTKKPLHIGIIGGGPASLFLFKKLIRLGENITVTIVEKTERLGAGMPYSRKGASTEHIANVSAHELPELPIDVYSYLKANDRFDYPDYYDGNEFNKYKVLPRLILGDYLEDQYHRLLIKAEEENIPVKIIYNTVVEDVVPLETEGFKIITNSKTSIEVDTVVVCTGHFWPSKKEGEIQNWFDCPYPPDKLSKVKNTPVAIKGTSLTAVDAIRTLARANGDFIEENGLTKYRLKSDCPDFRLDLFSTGGHLPAIRFHSDEEYYSYKWTMNEKDIEDYRSKNKGFIHLDYVFDLSFKKPMQEKDPNFYQLIKDMSIDEFALFMMKKRDTQDPFVLFQNEYKEAEISIREKKSISWKETLSAFSYAMNYPAKHFPAEDMLRLKKVVMPLITIIIAELPQSSAEEILALYESGLITLTEVDKDSSVEAEDGKIVYRYKNISNEDISETYYAFVDATGQQPINFDNFPFKTLKDFNMVEQAFLNFSSEVNTDGISNDYGESENIELRGDEYTLKVPGVNVGDHFEAINSLGEHSKSLYFMAVPMVGGLHPDYSGLDFCDTASDKVVKRIASTLNDLKITRDEIA